MELTQWTKVFRDLKGKYRFQPSISDKDLSDLQGILKDIAQLRHTAVHRLPVTARRITHLLESAVTLVRLLQDNLRAAQSEELLREVGSKISSMELAKNMLEDSTSTTLRDIERRRSELDVLEANLISSMIKNDTDNKALAGQLLETSVQTLFSDLQREVLTGENEDLENEEPSGKEDELARETTKSSTQQRMAEYNTVRRGQTDKSEIIAVGARGQPVGKETSPQDELSWELQGLLAKPKLKKNHMLRLKVLLEHYGVLRENIALSESLTEVERSNGSIGKNISTTNAQAPTQCGLSTNAAKILGTPAVVIQETEAQSLLRGSEELAARQNSVDVAKAVFTFNEVEMNRVNGIDMEGGLEPKIPQDQLTYAQEWIKETRSTVVYQHICTDRKYHSCSPEEIRLAWRKGLSLR